MKAILTSLASGLVLTGACQFASPGAQWIYDQEDDLYTMTVVRDTVLLGRTCSIIAGSSPSVCWQSHAYTYQSGDTVFWSDDAYLPQFFELYRWNATAGESWDVWSNGPVTVTYTVLSTGTTTVNGQELRTLNVEGTDTQQQWAQTSGVLVEHIGDTLFLFPWIAAFCDAIPPWPLRCYTDSDIGTFLRPGVTDCATATGIASYEFASTMTLSPNPAFVGETIAIIISGHPGPDHQVTIHDALGRLVHRERFNDQRLDVLVPTHGAYMITLHRDGTAIAQQRLMVR